MFDMIQRRVNGGDDPKLVECLNEVIPIYAVRWDVQQNNGTFGSSKSGTNYMEVQVWHEPTVQECQNIILEWHNKRIDNEILSGFSWNGMSVWLSTENQFNYKAAFDLAVQTEGATLPVTFKFGSTLAPVYHEFTALEELTDFYTKAMAYVSTVLKAGWMRKEAIDWVPYGGEPKPEEPEETPADDNSEDQTSEDMTEWQTTDESSTDEIQEEPIEEQPVEDTEEETFEGAEENVTPTTEEKEEEV